jgi:hypothetical protein
MRETHGQDIFHVVSSSGVNKENDCASADGAIICCIVMFLPVIFSILSRREPFANEKPSQIWMLAGAKFSSSVVFKLDAQWLLNTPTKVPRPTASYLFSVALDNASSN